MAKAGKSETKISIRMYRVGELGDCFLLTAVHKSIIRHLLIDCGSFRNGKNSIDRMRAIAMDIQKKVLAEGKRLHVVAGTHQHNDHVSGFVHAKDIFEKMKIEQVWLSWLDNPRSKVATTIGEEHLKLRAALNKSSEELKALARKRAARGASPSALKHLSEQKVLVDQLLGFFAAPALPSEGIRILKGIGENDVDYLNPGDLRVIPGIPASEIKIHVLGPPRDQELLYRKDPRKGESYDHKLHAMNSMSKHFLQAVSNQLKGAENEEYDFPFNRTYKRFSGPSKTWSNHLKEVVKSYNVPDNAWRNIDDDWLEQASHLALYMDTFTNNSSLALAIELVKSEKVLLFAADAQTGNWLSWEKVKFKDKNASVDNLLERTVFYKAGHHGSHNSTLKPIFEKITGNELVVMIPVDKTDPNIRKTGGWKMPAAKLFDRLKEKSENRVLRMDEGYARNCEPKGRTNQWSRVGKVDITDLYIEYTIS